MKEYALNDVIYNFKPFEIVTPDPDYTADEEQLKQSIQKNKAIITKIRENREKSHSIQ